MFQLFQKARFYTLVFVALLLTGFVFIILTAPADNKVIPLFGIFIGVVTCVFGIVYFIKNNTIPDWIGNFVSINIGFISFIAILVNGTVAVSAVPFVLSFIVLLSSRLFFSIISLVLIISSVYIAIMYATDMDIKFVSRTIISSFSVAVLGQFFYVFALKYIEEYKEKESNLLRINNDLVKANETLEALKKREKEDIYRATVESSQHILGNLLNKLVFVKMEIDKNASFSDDVSQEFNSMTAEAKKLVKKLSSVEEIEEKNIKDSVYPK